MTPYDFFAWAGRALSLFNLSALLWLSLTVLLNAERRSWGAWLAGGGLLLGSLVFAAHTALLTRQPYLLGPEMEWWWRAAWLPFVLPPYLWYVVMAWYTGRLKGRQSRLTLLVMTGWGVSGLVLLAAAGAFPSLNVLAQPPGDDAPPASTTALLLLYPGFSLVCILLALLALYRPAPSDRFMGDLGRRRAVPWLIGSSASLLAVAFVAGGVAAWFLVDGQRGSVALLVGPGTAVLLGLDAIIAGLVAVATVLMGRAIVSYEIFTGKVLPRGGLMRQWRGSLLLAAVTGVAGGAGLGLPLQPVPLVLLAGSIITALVALLSWQSYREQERSIERLRPFVSGPRFSQQVLLSAAGSGASDFSPPFRALCEEVLAAELAYLLPLGISLIPAGPPLAYPPGSTLPVPSIRGLAGQFHSPQMICLPVDPSQYGGAQWAVPLWSERGLTGVLLLGAKRDGALYTQEEMEIARAAGERLLDVQSGAEMARRLIELQRQRLAESRVLDRRARHVLHDEVLPRLHTAMLSLYSGTASGPSQPDETAALLAGVHQQIADLLRALPKSASVEVAQLGLLAALHQEVDSDLANEFDAVVWQVDPGAEPEARSLPSLVAEAVFGAAREAIRNAARHGRGNDPGRPLHLTITVTPGPGLRVVIEDDGVGLADEGSPADAAARTGSGHGLVLHSTMMAIIGGSLTLESRAGAWTRVTVTLPAGRGWAGGDET